MAERRDVCRRDLRQPDHEVHPGVGALHLDLIAEARLQGVQQSPASGGITGSSPAEMALEIRKI